MSPKNPTLAHHLKSRAAVVATVATAVLAKQACSDDSQYLEKPDATITQLAPSELVSTPIPESQLRLEYEAHQPARHVITQMGETRMQTYQVVKFIWRAGPPMAKANLQQKLSFEKGLSFQDLEKLGVPLPTFTPLVDLGAFDLAKLRKSELHLDRLTQAGIKEIVLMEDRDPQFYLNYSGYHADQTVPLNRHGSEADQWTMADLKNLIQQLHHQKIKTVIGFWGNTGNKDQNAFIRANWASLRPVIPGSDDINPLSFVKNVDGESMPFASYIISQYKKLKTDFGFDGVFLGDGLMGYRSFMDPHGPYEAEEFAYLWTDFYKRIYQDIKKISPQDTLWAYDCMGNGPVTALNNGLHLEQIAKYIDRYVFQGYGADAWGKDYMNLEGYNSERDQSHIRKLPEQLKVKTLYSVGLGDKVEGWSGNKESITSKHKALSPEAKQGALGVWSTGVLRNEL